MLITKEDNILNMIQVHNGHRFAAKLLQGRLTVLAPSFGLTILERRKDLQVNIYLGDYIHSIP